MKGNRHLYRVFLAALPVMSQADSFHAAFRGGGLAAGLFLISSAFFKISFPLFPKKIFRFAVLIFPAAAFQALFYAAEIPLIWAASLFLLYDFKELENGARGNGRIAIRGALYFAILCATGFAAQFFGRELDWGLFRHPAGILFLMTVFWVLLRGKTAPAKTAGRRRE